MSRADRVVVHEDGSARRPSSTVRAWVIVVVAAAVAFVLTEWLTWGVR